MQSFKVSAALAALLLSFSAAAVEPRPQHCEWLRARYSALFAQQQAGDKSPQLGREMDRFRRDYHDNECKGSILRR